MKRVTSFIDGFPETVRRHPNRLAVVDGDTQLTFGFLLDQSLRLGSSISERLANLGNNPVGVLLPKSAQSITADIAVLLSGNFYMNLDIKSPPARLAAILEQVKPALVITTMEFLSKFRQIFDTSQRFIILDQDLWQESAGNELSLALLRESIIDTDPMCIINTSGSTGTPKSVVLNHRSFRDYTQWAIENQELGTNEVIGSLAPIVFDHFSFELCMLIELGSTLVILHEEFAAFPARLLEIVAKSEVTFLFWVPTILVNIANVDLLSRIELPSLQHLWFAGEVFPTRQFNYWRRNLPRVRMTNLYGPAEITVDCTSFTIDEEWPEDQALPIGYACVNTDVLILDGDRECNPEEEGELCVRGTSLAMGYYNDFEKTSRAFVQNPLNEMYPELIYRTGDIVVREKSGLIRFLGRRDTLVKHSGYRIELTEIEHVVVSTLQLVSNGCAIYDSKEKQIVFVYEATFDLEAAEFRKKLGESLPKYMLPSRTIRLIELPRNTNGKIDRLRITKEVLS